MEDAGLVLLYALVASSRIKLRRLEGYEKIVEARDRRLKSRDL